MSNIKVGGKVFRDVEKMSLQQLEEVRKALVEQQLKLIGKAKVVPANAVGLSRYGVIQAEMKQIEARLARVDAMAKPIIKADTIAKLANVGEPSPEVTS